MRSSQRTTGAEHIDSSGTRAPRGLLDAAAAARHLFALSEEGLSGTMAQRIRKGDLVQVTTGNRRDRGKQGRVLAVDVERGRVRVEGVRVQKRHLKPGRQGARTGGIIEREGFLHASNVRLVDPKGGKPSRVRVETRGGKRVRVFVKSGEAVPEPAGR